MSMCKPWCREGANKRGAYIPPAGQEGENHNPEMSAAFEQLADHFAKKGAFHLPLSLTASIPLMAAMSGSFELCGEAFLICTLHDAWHSQYYCGPNTCMHDACMFLLCTRKAETAIQRSVSNVRLCLRAQSPACRGRFQGQCIAEIQQNHCCSPCQNHRQQRVEKHSWNRQRKHGICAPFILNPLLYLSMGWLLSIWQFGILHYLDRLTIGYHSAVYALKWSPSRHASVHLVNCLSAGSAD